VANIISTRAPLAPCPCTILKQNIVACLATCLDDASGQEEYQADQKGKFFHINNLSLNVIK
jgi:hypothetical protein